MRVHAGMPVETAKECRMQRTRRQHRCRVGDHMIELVGILARDVRKRETRETAPVLNG